MVIDLDKTAIGARGRNDQVIDQARVEGVRRTVSDLLGARFDEETFRASYEVLNQPAYHPFTADNQDNLAYLCLMVAGGMISLEALLAQVAQQEIKEVHDLMVALDRERARLEEAGLAPVHDAVYDRVGKGDPTPFKAFRRQEYLATAARFDPGPGVSAESMLEDRIVITQEVRETALRLGERGALIYDAQQDCAKYVKGYPVEAVDSTAAGDAFTAAMTFHYLRYGDMNQAVAYANAAGALTVTRLGAQPSLPAAREVEAFIRERGLEILGV